MSLYQDYVITEGGGLKTFIAHKLVHVAAGTLTALGVLHLGGGLLMAVVAACIIGIIREVTKQPQKLLFHILTGTITTSGAFLAPLLMHCTNVHQALVSLGLMAYCVVISVLQAENIPL